jgi:hypothetical protein
MTLRAWLWALIAILAAWLPAQGDCSTCMGRGALACPRCPVEIERRVEHCSVAAACASCRGALEVPCAHCENAEALARLRARQELVAAWRTAQDSSLVALAGGRGRLGALLSARGEHVELVFAPGRIEGCEAREPHGQMHLYLDRITAARQRFVEVLGLEPKDFPKPVEPGATVAAPAGGGSWRPVPSSRLHVYVLRDLDLHRRVCRAATGLVHQGVGSKLFGPRLVYALHHDDALGSDAELFRNLVHNATHLWLSHLEPASLPSSWIGELGHGWLDVGLASYFEALLVDGRCTSFCHLEHAQPPLNVLRGDWRTAGRDLLAKRRLATWESVLGQDSSVLTPEEHVLCFAAVAFLIESEGGKRVGELIRRIKQGSASATAIQSVFGADVRALDDKLRAWLAASGGKR